MKRPRIKKTSSDKPLHIIEASVQKNKVIYYKKFTTWHSQKENTLR